MNRNLTIKISILAGTALIAAVFLLTVIKMYEDTLDDAKQSHQLQQMEMAKAAANGINSYLFNIVNDMHLLSYYPGVQNMERDALRMHAEYFLKHYISGAVRTIFFCDKSAGLKYSAGETEPSWVIPAVKKAADSLKHESANSGYWFSEVHPLENNNPRTGLAFVILTPVKKLSGGARANSLNNIESLTGFIGYVVDFDILMQQFIVPLKLSEGDFPWVMDGEGRLIYHPRHKEMLLNSIYERKPGCIKCHSSFAMQKKMLAGGSSTGEYTIGNEPPKIVAYVPLKLSDKKWVLAISTFLPEVTAALRGKFNMFFGLGIVILIFIFMFGLLLYFINAKRIRAEEANRLLEQRQHFQDQLNHAAKLASIGELVDTVAHEINTPLGIISSHADALLLQKDYPEKFHEDLDIIKNQTRRASKYTRSLLGYSQRMPFKPAQYSINAIIDDCLYLLAHRIKIKRASIIKNYSNDVSTVYIDKGQMEQVLINLLNNALDAIKFNGEIKIDTGIGEDKFVYFKITDNGSGIAPENLENIFEPFFTTKSPNDGTGLGLSISKAIINRHRGKMEVKSERGKFTEFKIVLPYNNRTEERNEK